MTGLIPGNDVEEAGGHEASYNYPAAPTPFPDNSGSPA
jgi:hypothetical protein